MCLGGRAFAEAGALSGITTGGRLEGSASRSLSGLGKSLVGTGAGEEKGEKIALLFPQQADWWSGFRFPSRRHRLAVYDGRS